ncbi:hypothetical protein VTL71DRAFT_9850 [Oculimacula yallundae]|uniref:Protein kinase domain-containing protein n=1 Tax=Oculimacula yallundae TaxID=86028 RepID=A0ABR4BQM3_9HELO
MAGVAPATQGVAGWSGPFYRAYKFWDGMNDYPFPPPPRFPAPAARTNAAIQLDYIATQAIPYSQAPPTVPAIVIPLPAVPRAFRRPPGRPDAVTKLTYTISQDEQAFLTATNRPRGVGPTANWAAVKLLGSGTGGAAALWEWSAPVGVVAPAQTKLVVKTASNPRRPLTTEGRLMVLVGLSLSDHVTRLLVAPQLLTPAMCVARGLPAVWNNRTMQLVMEYCPHSSLADLHDSRKRRRIRFEEYTLWNIFECLVDGCSVLEYGTELVYNTLTQQATTPPLYVPAANPMTVVHRDLKPANIVFIGTRSASHVHVPVFKIGDFGAAEEWNKTFAADVGLWPPQTYAANHAQFRVPGPPEAHLPYTPPHAIHGAAPPGRLYGTQLRNQPGLSNVLKDTIHECLYEMPLDRATLLTLKTRIRTEINAMVLNPAIRPEGTQDLEIDETVSIAQNALAAYAVVGLPCTALLRHRDGSPPCGNNVVTRANNPRPRCQHHWDLREFPRN